MGARDTCRHAGLPIGSGRKRPDVLRRRQWAGAPFSSAAGRLLWGLSGQRLRPLPRPDVGEPGEGGEGSGLLCVLAYREALGPLTAHGAQAAEKLLEESE